MQETSQIVMRGRGARNFFFHLSFEFSTTIFLKGNDFISMSLLWQRGDDDLWISTLSKSFNDDAFLNAKESRERAKNEGKSPGFKPHTSFEIDCLIVKYWLYTNLLLMNSKNNNIILQKNDDNILLEFPLNINNFLFRCTAASNELTYNFITII